MMMKVWKWYQSCLSHRPLKTQVISSCVIWGVGDIACQYIAHSTKRNHLQLSHDKAEGFKVNWKRVAITSTFGFGYVGPVGHFWYKNLDKFTKFKLRLSPNSFRFVGAKVAMDTLIFGPLNYLVFFTYRGFSNGQNAEQVKEDFKRDFMIKQGGSGLGLFVYIVNFRYVPVRYQLLTVNMFFLLDSAFRSWESNKTMPLGSSG